MSERKSLNISVDLEEDDRHTEATARVGIGGSEYTGRGLARRSPEDPNVPMIGEELATARALSDLSHRLVDAATNSLEDKLGRPVSIEQ